MRIKTSRRMRIIKSMIDTSVQYAVLDGLKLLQGMKRVRFIESVDVAINLGIDARKSDQNVRGNVCMPHGIGREVRVAVFTQGENVAAAEKAGADFIGLEDLFEHIKRDQYKFDVVLASPDVMHIVSKLGSILGPRGLMPNLKMGTVSQDIAESVKNIKLGQVRYKNDKNGIIHAIIGRINFSPVQLQENLETLITSLKKEKPAQCRGTYIKKVTISTTMGGSIMVDKSSLYNNNGF